MDKYELVLGIVEHPEKIYIRAVGRNNVGPGN